MKISKDEIEQAAAKLARKSRYLSSHPFDETSVKYGAEKGAEWMYQQLEPLITDLSMDKARRQSDHFKQVTAYTDNTPVTASSCSMIAPQSEVMTLEEELKTAISNNETLALWYKEARIREEELDASLKQCQSDRDEGEQKIGKLEAELSAVKEERSRLNDALKTTHEALKDLVKQLPTNENLADYNLDFAEHADFKAQAVLQQEPKDTKQSNG